MESAAAVVAGAVVAVVCAELPEPPQAARLSTMTRARRIAVSFFMFFSPFLFCFRFKRHFYRMDRKGVLGSSRKQSWKPRSWW